MERLPQEGFSFSKLREQKEAEGWHFFKREGLAQTKFQDGKFNEIPYQTEDSIKEKYISAMKAQDPSSKYEVDLVLDENTEKLRKLREISSEEEYRGLLDNLHDADKSYFVFVRKAGS